MGNPNAEPETVAFLDPNGPQSYKSALLWTATLGPLLIADREVRIRNPLPLNYDYEAHDATLQAIYDQKKVEAAIAAGVDTV